jgi:sigma-B regulation protein RsbU (phosphoserine phosphatase)
MALGVEGTCSYLSGGRSGLSAGDVLVIGTDGVWETQGPGSGKFGKARIDENVRRHREQRAEAIINSILWDLAEFRGENLQEDDITLVVVKVADTRQG